MHIDLDVGLGAERERGLRVHVDEDLLHRHLQGRVLGDDALQAFEDRFQPRGQVAGAGLDAATRDVPQPPPARLDDAKSGDLQPRIDPEDLQSSTAVV